MSDSPHSKHVPEFDALAAHIRSVSNRERLLFCPSPGNWGDAIINAGSRTFFAKYGFNYIEIRREKLFAYPHLSESHLVVGGGGGWCEFWHSTPELVERVAPMVRHLTLLPTTLGTVPNEPSLPGHVSLFARDQSYSMAQYPRAKFCHDMAFHYSPTKAHRGSAVRNHRLVAMRADKEVKPFAEEMQSLSDSDNRDLSLEGGGLMDPSGLYARLTEYGSVMTDRLHLGIAGAQLGLNVKLYPSAYPKIESVFESSIENVFPNVQFIAE